MSQKPSSHQHPRRPRFDLALIVVLGLSLISAVVVYRREGMAAVGHILVEDVWLLASILPKVAAGCIL